MSMSLDDVIKGTCDKFNDERAVMRLTDKAKNKVPAQRTGIPQLDNILGVGGLPKGRIVEIIGPESSGKTTLALSTIAQAQKEGSWCWFGDMEHALDPAWAQKLGVDLDKLLVSQPSSGEECLDLAEHFIRTGVIDIVVIDSVASLVPKAELEGDMGDSHMGLQARLMSQACRKLTGVLSRMDCIAIFINQIREKIGVMFGSPETTPGGRALKFYASVRLDVRRIGSSGKKGEETGNKIKITCKKNKLAPPFKICEAELMFDKGFDLANGLFEAGLAQDKIEKSGQTYSWGEISVRGKDAFQDALRSLESEKLQELYKGLISVKESPKENNDEIKQKIAKYEKKLLEATTDEDKDRYTKKLDKYKAKLAT